MRRKFFFQLLNQRLSLFQFTCRGTVHPDDLFVTNFFFEFFKKIFSSPTPLAGFFVPGSRNEDAEKIQTDKNSIEEDHLICLTAKVKANPLRKHISLFLPAEGRGKW